MFMFFFGATEGGWCNEIMRSKMQVRLVDLALEFISSSCDVK